MRLTAKAKQNVNARSRPPGASMRRSRAGTAPPSDLHIDCTVVSRAEGRVDGSWLTASRAAGGNPT